MHYLYSSHSFFTTLIYTAFELVLRPDCLALRPAQCAFCEKPLRFEQLIDFLYFLVQDSNTSRAFITDPMFAVCLVLPPVCLSVPDRMECACLWICSAGLPFCLLVLPCLVFVSLDLQVLATWTTLCF